MLPETTPLSVALSRQNHLFDTIPPDPDLLISVIIPARNEADNLMHALHALRNQRQVDGTPIREEQFEILLLLNNCTDHSAAIAEQYQQQFPTFPLRVAAIQLPPEKANVGTARRLLMDAACRRLLQVGRPHGIIASTDADTTVDSHWIDQICMEISKGCEVVGGRILTRPDRNPVRLNHLRDVTYRMLKARLEACLDPSPFDPWPRHFQHFGASLALTCAAYERVGGLPNVAHLEDEALYHALQRMDTRIRKSPHVRVTTSTRMQGQVAVGFSEQLRYWETQNKTRQCQLSEPAGALIRRFLTRHRLRLIWQNRPDMMTLTELKAIAADLMIDVNWLRSRLDQAGYFGQLWQDIELQMAHGTWGSHWKPVPITVAISELRLFLRTVE